MTDHTLKPDWDESTPVTAAVGSYLRVSENDPVIGLQAQTYNDYSPGSYGHIHLTVASAGTATITGFDTGISGAGLGGRVLFITCEGGTINLAHQSAGSSAANRLSNLTAGNVVLTPFQRAMYVYSGTVKRWYELPLLTNSLDIDALTVAGAASITSVYGNQLTVKYDTNNYLQVNVASNGVVTLNATGTAPAFAISDALTVSGVVKVADGAVTSGSQAIQVASDTNIGLYKIGAGALGITGGSGGLIFGVGTNPAGVSVYYDGSNYVDISVSSAGLVTYDATGSGAAHSFSDLVTAAAGLTVSSGQTLTVTGATVTGLTAASVGAGTFPSGAYVFQGAVSGITTLGCSGTLTVNSLTTINGTTGYITVPENGPATPQFKDANDNGFWTTTTSEDRAGVSVLGQTAFVGGSTGPGNVKIGFYDTNTPVAKQTVTGSRGANAALASLLTALASLNLITDSSS